MSESSPKIFWLCGAAGSGKTAIAHTVAQKFALQKQLAGCFFCCKDDASRRNSERIMPTIAYQLTKWHRAYRSLILDLLHGA